MTGFALLIFAPSLLLIIRATLRNKEQNNSPLRRVVFFLYAALILTYVIVLYAGTQNFFIKGFRSTSVLFIIMTAAGAVYWLIDRNKIFTNVFRAILFFFSLLTTGLSTFLALEIVDDYNEQLYYSNHNYRLEDTWRVMRNCTLPTLFVKHRFYEQEYKPVDSTFSGCMEKGDLAKIEIRPLEGNKVAVLFSWRKEIPYVSNPYQVIYSKK